MLCCDLASTRLCISRPSSASRHASLRVGLAGLVGGFLLAISLHFASLVFIMIPLAFEWLFELGGWPTGLMSCTSRGHMGGLLCCALNFLFCTGREVFPLYLSTISRRSSKWLVGVGWVWVGVWVWAWGCLGGRNSRLKILLVSFCTFADCEGWIAMRWMGGR